MEEETLEQIRKVYYKYQLYDQSPFKFSIQDECNFNFEIIINIIYLDRKPVLHVINAATLFQATKFLKLISVRDTYNALYDCYINVY